MRTRSLLLLLALTAATAAMALRVGDDFPEAVPAAGVAGDRPAPRATSGVASHAVASLAVASTTARAAPADAPRSPRPVEPASEVEVPVELRAVSAADGLPCDPGAFFAVREWGVGSWGWREESTGSAVGVLRVPAGTTEDELWVSIDGWGFRPWKGRVVVPVLANEDAARRIDVRLEPVPATEWSTARVVLEGEGEFVGDGEALSVTLGVRPSDPDRPGRPGWLRIPFPPGAPRAIHVAVPTPAFSAGVGPVSYVDGAGRKVFADLARVASVSRDERGPVPVVRVTRRPSALLVLTVEYANEDLRRRPYAISGRWTTPRVPSGRMLTTTFYSSVEAGADVVIVAREEGRLMRLDARGAGVAGVDPPGEIVFEEGVVERRILRLEPSPRAK